MKILTKKAIKKLAEANYDSGFRDAVDSMVKLIESHKKIVLGNGMSFVGMKATAPVALVGNHVHIANSQFSLDKLFKKNKDACCVKICGKL